MLNKRAHTSKHLLKRRQCGIGGHGGAQCGHVADLVVRETMKRKKTPINSQSIIEAKI